MQRSNLFFFSVKSNLPGKRQRLFGRVTEKKRKRDYFDEGFLKPDTSTTAVNACKKKKSHFFSFVYVKGIFPLHKQCSEMPSFSASMTLVVTVVLLLLPPLYCNYVFFFFPPAQICITLSASLLSASSCLHSCLFFFLSTKKAKNVECSTLFSPPRSSPRRCSTR